MSLISRTALLESYLPLLQAKRLRSKINIQKPKPPHHEKAKFLKIAQPFYINPNKDKLPFELCTNEKELSNDIPVHPYYRLIANELLTRFQTSRLVAFFHMNSMNGDEQFKAYAAYKKQNMYFQTYPDHVMKLALEGTPYEAILDLYVSENVMVFSPEPEIKPLLKAARKFKQLVLLAGLFEGKFVSKDELMEYSLIPDVKSAQAGLVYTLNSIGGKIVGQLTTHQNVLVNQLQERAKQLEGQ